MNNNKETLKTEPKNLKINPNTIHYFDKVEEAYKGVDDLDYLNNGIKYEIDLSLFQNK